MMSDYDLIKWPGILSSLVTTDLPPVVRFTLVNYHELPQKRGNKQQKKQKEIKLNSLISLVNINGDPYGTRTRVTGVRGRRPRPLDEGATNLINRRGNY